MFRFNLKAVACGLALMGAMATVPSCSANSQERPVPSATQHTKPQTPPEEDTPEYQFWANFCGNIRILMSSGGVEWHINLLPGEKIGLSSPNIDDLIATKRPYFEKMLAQGVFSADTPRDFRVAIKERCTRLG